MARGDQLSRQWKIIHTLIAFIAGKTVTDLAEELGCTPRTVYRDLEALQAGGFPITTETRENRRYWCILNSRRQQVPLAFSIPELMALYFGKDMLKTYRGTVFYDAIDSLLSKIKATLRPLTSTTWTASEIGWMPARHPERTIPGSAISSLI